MNTLLFLTLGGSALSLLLLALRYGILRRMPSTVYYYAWVLVLLRFALPLPGLIPVSIEAKAPDTAVYRESGLPDREEPMSGPLSDAAPGGAPAVGAERRLPVPSAEAAGEEAPSPAETALSFDWRSPGFWLSVWALGAALRLGWTVFAYLRFTVCLRRGLRRPDRRTRELYEAIPGRKPGLYRSDSIRTPLMYGVFTPKIVLPGRLRDEELTRNILRHELMHYRRLDALFKWCAVMILSAHWFNPLSWFIQREIGRACELSCDEMLLRTMDRSQRQSYGNTLLSMAAASALPAGVVATTFSTEKKNLRERLEQIMKYKKSRGRMAAAVLALALLAGCGMAAGPQPQAAPAAEAPVNGRDGVPVSTVDQFLAAIAPDTTILMEAGEYDLSAAADYGAGSGSPYYHWEAVYSDNGSPTAELVIEGVRGLAIEGEGLESTTIAAVPRYANVIRFRNCSDLSVKHLTAGHTKEPGLCAGGVLRLEGCRDVSVTECGLYGCGTVGVEALDTEELRVSGCSIYECSYEAVSLHACRQARIENCRIYSHGVREGPGSAMALFSANYSDGVVIRGNRIYENHSQFLLTLSYTKNAMFLSNTVQENRFDAAVFAFEPYGATVDGCAFLDNGTIRQWVQSSGVYANDVTGRLLDDADFASMTFREVEPGVSVSPAPAAAPAEALPGSSIEAATVDEFLAAIGPDRTIILNGEWFDLSAASNYGSVGGEYYYWQESHDGPQLVIRNADGLRIRAKENDPKATTLAAVPRFANVLAFRDCNDLQLTGFTAGHTEEPGACSGGVLFFQNCSGVRLADMRLFGCGILGVQASYCTSLEALRTEIYECNQGAGQFFQCDDVRFVDCEIRDVPSPALTFTECGEKSWNGEPIPGPGWMYDVDADGVLRPFTFE